jgi:hypothetical protein
MMVTNKAKMAPENKKDTKRLLIKVRKASDLAEDVLNRYGEPTISLVQLRKELNLQLQDISLNDTVLKDRESRW